MAGSPARCSPSAPYLSSLVSTWGSPTAALRPGKCHQCPQKSHGMVHGDSLSVCQGLRMSWLCPIAGYQGFPSDMGTQCCRTSFHGPILAHARWHQVAVPQEHHAGQDHPWHPCLLHSTHPCSTAHPLPLWSPGTSCTQDLCATAAPSRRGDLHPKQGTIGLGRRAAGLGIPSFAAGVTTPVTGPDPAMPMRIENPTGKCLWAGQGSACPALTPQRWALSLPAGHVFPPEPPGRGLGALQATGPGGAGWGAGARLARRETSLAASC